LRATSVLGRVLFGDTVFLFLPDLLPIDYCFTEPPHVKQTQGRISLLLISQRTSCGFMTSLRPVGSAIFLISRPFKMRGGSLDRT